MFLCEAQLSELLGDLGAVLHQTLARMLSSLKQAILSERRLEGRKLIDEAPCYMMLWMLQVLQRLSFHDSSIKKAMIGESRVILMNYWFTYCVLKARAPKYQRSDTQNDS